MHIDHKNIIAKIYESKSAYLLVQYMNFLDVFAVLKKKDTISDPINNSIYKLHKFWRLQYV